MWRARAMAVDGLRKRPPSENESGVTLSTPMTAGRPSASNRASTRESASSRTDGVMVLALRRPRQQCQASCWDARSIGDLLGQLLGVLDPAPDQLLRWQKTHQLSPLVGLGHGFG